MRQITGSEHYDMAMVTRWLTEEGERLLAEQMGK
jgi:hypothetical protein